jgi:thiol-disulfide isomerase/thioredoxin
MNLLLRGAATTALALAAALATAAPEGWYHSLDEAIVAAKREGKPILADFSTSWCHNCRTLEQNTLSNPEVTARLDKYVKVYVDGDQHRQMVSAFGVSGYPTLVAISPEGYELTRSVGYVGANQLAMTLDGALRAVGPSKAELRQMTPQMQPEGPADALEPQVGETDLAAAEEVDEVGTLAPDRLDDRAAAVEQRATPNREINYYTMFAESQQVSKPANIELASSSAPTARFQSSVETGASANPVKTMGEEAAGGGAEAGLALVAQATDQLPKPLLNAGSTRQADVSRSTPAQGKAAATPAAPAPASSNAVKQPAGKPEVKTAAASGKADILKTVRKLQSDEEPAVPEMRLEPEPTKSAPVQTVQEAEAPAEPGSSDTPKLAIRKNADTPAKPEATKAAREPAPPAETESVETASVPNAGPRSASAASTPRGNTAAADAPSKDDIQRWMKIGDEKLVAGLKKEAHAQYAKVVDRDPANARGMTDLAYIKMVALMVDRDEEALRQQAYDMIREFEARFPDSRNKDYYTVIRAMFAADLGKYAEAHALLDDFPTRFPNSRYIEMAHETWQDLPPASRDSSTRNSSSASGRSSQPGSSGSSAAARSGSTRTTSR